MTCFKYPSEVQYVINDPWKLVKTTVILGGRFKTSLFLSDIITIMQTVN